MPTGSIRILKADPQDLRLVVTAHTKTVGKVVRICHFIRDPNGYHVHSSYEGDDSGNDYYINTTRELWTCSCPDALRRNPNSCKHILALKTGLSKIGGES